MRAWEVRANPPPACIAPSFRATPRGDANESITPRSRPRESSELYYLGHPQGPTNDMFVAAVARRVAQARNPSLSLIFDIIQHSTFSWKSSTVYVAKDQRRRLLRSQKVALAHDKLVSTHPHDARNSISLLQQAKTRNLSAFCGIPAAPKPGQPKFWCARGLRLWPGPLSLRLPCESEPRYGVLRRRRVARPKPSRHWLGIWQRRRACETPRLIARSDTRSPFHFRRNRCACLLPASCPLDWA
jgi:hypothetical protein